jgi:hypothetical protein
MPFVRPLLAVAAVAATACSAPSPSGAHPSDPDPPAVAAPSSPASAVPAAALNASIAFSSAPATPRLMPSGRPACGNVMTRFGPVPGCAPR